MLSAADISTLDNTAGALANPTFPNPSGSAIWAPTFYDPFQVKHRRRTSKKQFSILEKAFNENPKPNAATRRDLAEKLKMTVRGVQVWFQNRRAKAKAQKLKMAKKNGSTASSPSESEKNTSSTPNDTTTENTTENVNNKNESTESLTTAEKTDASPSENKELKEESKASTLDMDNKLKLENKEYPYLKDNYFQVDGEVGPGMVPYTEPASDYFFDKQDPTLNQGFGPSSLQTDFYGGATPIGVNRRGRTNSLPNVYNLGMYVSPHQQSLVSPLNKTIPFQGLHQHPQSYSLIGGPKSTSGSYSPQSLQFIRQKSPYSPNTLLYAQKSQSLPSMGPSNDSSTSSPTLSGSEKGSQARFSNGLAKHQDIFYTGIEGAGMNGGRGFVNYMVSPGLGDNIPSPRSTASNGNVYSPSYQNYLPDVSAINGIRPIDDSFAYNPYSLNQQAINNPYAGNIQNFVPELNAAGTSVLQGIPSYPTGFNAGRRNSCPPELFTSVNSLPLSLDDNLNKQKGLETIKEDESIE